MHIVTFHLFSFSELREYCTWDVFEASCQPDEVVIMRQARYGRMRIGQCVKRDFGFLGCQTDVVTHMDSLCSGRRSCEVVIPDETMRDMEPCSELEAYLEASYDCHKGKDACITEKRTIRIEIHVRLQWFSNVAFDWLAAVQSAN